MTGTNELMDMMLSGETAENISDKIKELLYTKSADNISNLTPIVAKSIFSQEEE
jgi:hypothetical protein